VGKPTKAKSGGEMTSQSPKGAASTEQRSGEAQGLKEQVGQQVNLLSEAGSRSQS
jgi:hypothetical protein